LSYRRGRHITPLGWLWVAERRDPAADPITAKRATRSTGRSQTPDDASSPSVMAVHGRSVSAVVRRHLPRPCGTGRYAGPATGVRVELHRCRRFGPPPSATRTVVHPVGRGGPRCRGRCGALRRARSWPPISAGATGHG